MSTPADVFDGASTYLHIYFMGITGLLIYNIGSGVLRAVGDTTRPLYFLIFTCILNIGLDLLFVLVFHLGIAGTAFATIIAQLISALLVLRTLTATREVYQLTWKDLRLTPGIMKEIVSIGLPTAIQSIITQFSNVFVQGYINFFGATCIAGYACYSKVEQFVFLPIQSMGIAATTFVSQNIGANQKKRADQGARMIIGLSLVMVSVIVIPIILLAKYAVGLFTSDSEVIAFGVQFVRLNVFFILFNCVNHVLAGVLRGIGHSVAPMLFMLANFVALRQLYLYVATHFIANTPRIVAFGYPFGWIGAAACTVIYYLVMRRKFFGD
jgi:putative MATE family efflux protein